MKKALGVAYALIGACYYLVMCIGYAVSVLTE